MAGAEENSTGSGTGTTATLGSIAVPLVPRVGSDVGHHWSRHLKCQVCFGYLQQPHTLPCGHSFCRLCLVRLGRITRNSHPDISLRYLCLLCPTCRAPFPASAILRGRASTSFLIQNIVCDWKKERKRIRRASNVTLRSISTQTTNRTHRLRPLKTQSATIWDMHEQFHKRVKLDDYYYHCLAVNSSDSSEETEDIKSSLDRPSAQSQRHSGDPAVDASDTSTVSSTSSGPGILIGHHIAEIGHHFPAGHRTDWSPGRVLLMSVWCVYSMVVVGIAQPMLPYMVLITFFFVFLVLK